MSIESSLFTALSGDGDVGPLVRDASVSPQQYRIYPEFAPDQVARPFIVYSMIFGEHLQTLASGRTNIKRGRMQVDCYATTYNGARTLADHVYDAVDTNMKAGSLSETSMYLEDTELYRISLDFSLWE